MVNNAMVVGRIFSLNEYSTPDGSSKYVEMVVKVDDTFNKDRNKKDYKYFYVKCFLNGSVAENTLKYCKIGDIIGVRGHLENMYDNENNCNGEMFVYAEKVTFLSSNANKINDKLESEDI